MVLASSASSRKAKLIVLAVSPLTPWPGVSGYRCGFPSGTLSGTLAVRACDCLIRPSVPRLASGVHVRAAKAHPTRDKCWRRRWSCYVKNFSFIVGACPCGFLPSGVFQRDPLRMAAEGGHNVLPILSCLWPGVLVRCRLPPLLSLPLRLICCRLAFGFICRSSAFLLYAGQVIYMHWHSYDVGA